LAVGAFIYWGLARLLDRHSGGSGAGTALALGAFLDGIPEQLVLGIGPATGGGVSVALLVMLVDSMVPEATSKAGSSAGLVTTLGFAVAAGLSSIS